jgi:sortase A
MCTMPAPNPHNGERVTLSAWAWLRSPVIWAVCCLLALVFAAAIWQSSVNDASAVRAEASATPSLVMVASPPTHTATATPEPSRTATPTPTSLPTSTPRPVAYGPPTRLRIPKIGLDADVVEVGYEIKEVNGESVTVWEVADFAAGFHRGSAYPGHPGNTVIAGHNNIRGRVFRHLLDVRPGDDIYLYVGEQEFHYVVTQRLLVKDEDVADETRLENAKWIQPTRDERLTLVSCWPFIQPDHRVVVVAHPASG